MVIGIIGGGASGMAAAIAAAQNPAAEVIVMERQARVGRKLQATGNGRCNLSNSNAALSQYHGQQAAFCKKALEAFDVYRYKLPWCDAYSTYIYVDLLDEQGSLVQRQVEMQVPCKHFEWERPTVTAEFRDVDGGVEIAVTGDTFTRGVMLDFDGFDCVLTDNFFSITDAEPSIVTARTDRSAAELKAALTVKTVYDIR